MFDKDRGAEIFLRAMGGHYARLSPGEPTGFNPLKLPDTAHNRAFLRDWAASLLQADGSEELGRIAAAVDACYAHDAGFRRLRHFGELLGGSRRPEPGDLLARLQPWIGGGEHAWLFDNADDQLDLEQHVLGFDMTAVLDTPTLRTPAMMYLFHRIDERLNGDPTMILIDEGWKALDDAVFAARIRDWLKTLRKRNAVVGFGTQSARDALESRISSAIVEQTATSIFMPNARARAEDYCDGFGLTEHELELIRACRAFALLPGASRQPLHRGAAGPLGHAGPVEGAVGPRGLRAPAGHGARSGGRRSPPLVPHAGGPALAGRRQRRGRALAGGGRVNGCPTFGAGGAGGIAEALRAVDCQSAVAVESAFARLFGVDGVLGQALGLALTLYVGSWRSACSPGAPASASRR
jgi:hypothetical protein